MFEEIAYEHGADLRREAAAYRRVASRADRAAPWLPRRVSRSIRATLAHRAPVGCEA